MEKALGQAMDKFGRLDGVVNCTGDMTMKPAHLTGEDEFMDGMRINALSSFNVIAAAVRAARRAGRQACMHVAGPGRRGRCACAICCARAIRAAPRCVQASASCGARIGACHRSGTVWGQQHGLSVSGHAGIGRLWLSGALSEEERQQAGPWRASALLGRPQVQPLMKSGGGSIVLVSSSVAYRGYANHEAISAAKGAVNALALSAASTYAPHNIRVNVCSPGLVRAASPSAWM